MQVVRSRKVERSKKDESPRDTFPREAEDTTLPKRKTSKYRSGHAVIAVLACAALVLILYSTMDLKKSIVYAISTGHIHHGLKKDGDMRCATVVSGASWK